MVKIGCFLTDVCGQPPKTPLKTPHFRTKYLSNDFILPRYKSAVAGRADPFTAIYDGFMFGAVQRGAGPSRLRGQTEQPRRREQISRFQEQEPTTSRVGYNRIIYILYRVFVKFWVFRYRKSVKFKPIYRDLVKFCDFGYLSIAKWSKFVIFTVPVSQIRQNQGVFYCQIFVCSIANRSNSGFFLSYLDYFSLTP